MTKTILITGASTGIGKALAYQYAGLGYHCICVSRRIEACQSVASNCKELGAASSHAIKCDVSLADDTMALKKELDRLNLVIDIVVLNAGISGSGSSHQLSTLSYRKIYETNVFGVLNCLESLIPKLITQGFGHIVLIGSLSSYRGLPQTGAYGSSKAALHYIAETLRLDLKPYGLDVSIIHPGFIKTPLTDKNTFKMPFLMSAEKAAAIIQKAIHRKKAIYAFPFIMACAAKLQVILPSFIRDLLLRNVKNTKEL